MSFFLIFEKFILPVFILTLSLLGYHFLLFQEFSAADEFNRIKYEGKRILRGS